MRAPAAGIDTSSGICPRCDMGRQDGAPECVGCGVVFARLDRPRAAPRTAPVVDFRVEYDPARLEPEGRRALVVGAAITVLVLAVPFLRFVVSYLGILVHELGHALSGWLFGYPSIPAFDFLYGGGVTSHDSRQTGLLVVLYVGWFVGLYAYRRHRTAMAVIGSLLVLYTICNVTVWHEHLITLMGHGAELLFAGIFFYRALSGYAVQVAVERPLYAFLALFLVAADLQFALGLARSSVERELYAGAKGGGHWMDFSRLARDLNVELTTVAWCFAVACVLVLPVTGLIFRNRSALAAAFSRTFLEPLA